MFENLLLKGLRPILTENNQFHSTSMASDRNMKEQSRFSELEPKLNRTYKNRVSISIKCGIV